MIINSGNLRTLTTGYRASFREGLAAVAPMWARFATEVPSTTSEELYPWLEQIPGMRKWIGERQVKNVRNQAYRLSNEDWESTVSVQRNAILDDRYGVYTPMMRMMGDAAARQPDEVIFAALATGFTTPCFDGQNFFDTDHPVLDANGSEISVSNMQAGAGPAWFLLDTTKVVKPLIFQNRQAPQFAAQDNPDDETVFNRKVFVYGSDARNTAGFGFWQTAFGSKAELSAANFTAAFDAMATFKKDYGAPLAITPNVLLVGPSNRAAGEAIVKKMNLAGGESNLDYGRAELVVCPWLA